MKLKSSYESVGDVPELFKSAYTEQDGKYVLTGEIEVKTQEDIDSMKQAKDNANAELSQMKSENTDLKQSKIDIQNKLEAVELQLNDNGSADKIQATIAEKVELATKELREENQTLKSERDEFQTKVFSSEKQGLINSNLDKFGEQSRGDAKFFFDSILERNEVSGEWVTNGKGEIDKGLTLDKALERVAEMKSHWLPQNKAGNAQSSMSTGGVKTSEARFKELHSKSQSGTITAKEQNEMIKVSREIRAEQNNGE